MANLLKHLSSSIYGISSPMSAKMTDEADEFISFGARKLKNIVSLFFFLVGFN